MLVFVFFHKLYLSKTCKMIFLVIFLIFKLCGVVFCLVSVTSHVKKLALVLQTSTQLI